ncbi:MAG: S41 family peptidase [Alphaproteobacteria bacterium]|nr:S41 family peptidase [Alphaproteobacteria bacterium]
MPFPSISNLEEKLLSLSDVSDVVVAGDGKVASGKKLLNSEEVKKEISIFSRILINGYCGWPFHSWFLKWSVLVKLNKLFKMNRNTSTEDLFENLGEILKKIPDMHIAVRFAGKRIGRPERRHIDVGKNLAGDDNYKIEKLGRLAVVAVRRQSGTLKWTHGTEFFDAARQAIEDSDGVIIDVRGNGGGRSCPMDMLAKYLNGAVTPSNKRSFVRGTPEGKIIRGKNFGGEGHNNDDDLPNDPFVWTDYANKAYPKFQGIEKPVYILTDSISASAPEFFITKMSRHPYMTIVGENTNGCEIYGNVNYTVLPYSRIVFQVGMVHRELEVGNIECKGYAPDIRVPEGEDAFDYAVDDFMKTSKFLQACKTCESAR